MTYGQRDGVVYLLKSGLYYKIGMTRNLSRRFDQLAIQLSERSVIIHTFHTDAPAWVEKSFHARFADKRKNGEWFDLTPEDVEEFCRYHQMNFYADEAPQKSPHGPAEQALREAREALGPEPTNFEDSLGI